MNSFQKIEKIYFNANIFFTIITNKNVKKSVSNLHKAKFKNDVQ
jgi:hypothetical protein